MTLKDDLTNYRPPQPRVERIEGSQITIFLGDEEAPLGSALGFAVEPKPLFGIVQRHLGARRAQAWLPAGADEISLNTPLIFSKKTAALPLPKDQKLDPSTPLIRPRQEDDLPIWPEPPLMANITGHRPPLPIGIEPLDILAPLCLGGLNLIVDTTDDDKAFEAIATKAMAAQKPEHLILPTKLATLADQTSWQIAPGDSADQKIFRLQLLIALANHLRQTSSTLAILELPTPGEFDPQPRHSHLPSAGLAEIIDRLGRHLVSTKDASITTILRLQLPSSQHDLSQIIETLHLGDLDALIYLTDDGRFDPRRSSSRAEIGEPETKKRHQMLQLLNQAQKAQDKKAIFGDFDLSHEERQALKDAPSLFAPIA